MGGKSAGSLSLKCSRVSHQAMNSSLDPNMIEKMFAYADSDGSGLITQDWNLFGNPTQECTPNNLALFEPRTIL